MGIYMQLRETLKEGEHYAGVILGKGGEADHHLILLPGDLGDISWPGALDWAGSQGGELPNRRELSLLFANLREQFERESGIGRPRPTRPVHNWSGARTLPAASKPSTAGLSADMRALSGAS